jgi:hypothetical protein
VQITNETTINFDFDKSFTDEKYSCPIEGSRTFCSNKSETVLTIFVFYMYVPSVFRALDPTYFREPHKFQKEKQVFRFSVCSSRELSSPPIIAAATITLSPML